MSNKKNPPSNTKTWLTIVLSKQKTVKELVTLSYESCCRKKFL